MDFTEEQLQILKKANITKDRFQDCYFTDDNKLFIKTKDKTAQEVYQEWIKNKDKKQEQETIEDYLMDMDYRLSKLELGLEE